MIVLCLLGERFQRRGHGHPHIGLGHMQFQTQVGQSLEIGPKILCRRELADGHVHLQTHTVHRHATTPQIAQEFVNRVRLPAESLPVEIVVEQDGGRIDFVRLAEGELDVVRTDHPLPDTLPPRAIVFECLVDDVPELHPSLVAGDHRRNVLPQDGEQCLTRPLSGLKPCRELLVPDQRVAMHPLGVRLGELHQRIAVTPMKAILSRTQRPHLHDVGRCEHRKLASRNLAIARFIAKRRGIDRDPELHIPPLRPQPQRQIVPDRR